MYLLHFHSKNKIIQFAISLQVSIDVAWSPDCIDLRCYDYAALAENSDLSFIMAYDERSQIFDECMAWANSPFNNTYHGEWSEENAPLYSA